MKSVVKPSPTIYPLGLRVGKTKRALILDFLNDRDDSTVEVVSSIALDYEMAVQLIDELSEFTALVDKENESEI